MYDAIDVTGTQVGSRQGCFGSIDPAIGVYILARYIPSRPRQLCIINSALEPAVATRSSPAKRTINATGTLHANHALSFSPILAKHLFHSRLERFFFHVATFDREYDPVRRIDRRTLLVPYFRVPNDISTSCVYGWSNSRLETNAEVKINGFFFFHFDSLKNTRKMKHGLSTEQ